MWTSLRIYIYKIVDFISGLSGLLYRTGWTSVNGILIEMENILQIKGITIPEMSIILALQKSTKSGKLYSYLCGGDDEVDKQGENNG